VSLERLLRALADALSTSNIPFMLTGSVAAAFHGASRATMDVDLVIEPTAHSLQDFVRRVEELGLYISADAAREAYEARGMFNVVDSESGWKADLIIRKQRSFSEKEFSRREPTSLQGVPLAIATIEDLILSKLEWARLGGSARQLEDVRALLGIAGEELDRSYLEQWVDHLGVRREWNAARRPTTP
jgi:hypothetical protein